MYKIIGSDQKIYGPVTVAQLRQWQNEGRVNFSTLVQAEGSAEWKPLSSLPELVVPPVLTMPPARAAQPNNNLAVAGLTFGVLSNVCCCLGIPFAVLGIIFSAMAFSQQDNIPREGGKSMALCGLILSVVGLAWRSVLPLAFLGLPTNHIWLHHYLHHW